MTVILFIVILAILVFVHELGHFLVAKASGIRVDEFGLGFPPKVFGVKYGETTYSLNWIPFGGFVKIFGENPDEDSTVGTDKDRSMVHKPKYIQALVLVAGIGFNIIFAWLLISLGFMIGMPVPSDYSSSAQILNPQVTVTSIQPGAPADKAGLKEGDILESFASGLDTLAVKDVTSVQNFIAAHPSQSITVNYEYSNQQHTATLVPVTGIVGDRAAIGISLDSMGILKLSFFKALYEGAKLTVYLVQETAIGIGQFIFQAVTGKAHLSEVTGPVGIAGLVGDAQALGFVYLLSFTSLISINLAIINLIPFPALDGGRLLMVLIEKIKGSALNPKYANAANLIGFVVLILFMLVVTFHDIFNLIHK